MDPVVRRSFVTEGVDPIYNEVLSHLTTIAAVDRILDNRLLAKL